MELSRLSQSERQYEEVDLNVILTGVLKQIASTVTETDGTVEFFDLPKVWCDSNMLSQ